MLFLYLFTQAMIPWSCSKLSSQNRFSIKIIWFLAEMNLCISECEHMIDWLFYWSARSVIMTYDWMKPNLEQAWLALVSSSFKLRMTSSEILCIAQVKIFVFSNLMSRELRSAELKRTGKTWYKTVCYWLMSLWTMVSTISQ